MTTNTAYLLYFVFALGGAALYLMLPKGDRTQTGAGAVIGLLALASLVAALAARVVAPDPTTTYFYLFSIAAILAAARVVTHAKPVYSALYFVLVVVAVAALLVLLAAEFLAIALIIIYAGAILVTYLFVIMLAQQPGSPIYDRRAREPFLGVAVGFLLMAAVAGRAGAEADVPTTATPPPPAAVAAVAAEADVQDERGNTAAIGAIIMTRHVVTLQLAGLLLLISLIGALALARKRVPTEFFAPPRPPLGQVGKEVPPF